MLECLYEKVTGGPSSRQWRECVVRWAGPISRRWLGQERETWGTPWRSHHYPLTPSHPHTSWHTHSQMVSYIVIQLVEEFETDATKPDSVDVISRKVIRMSTYDQRISAFLVLWRWISQVLSLYTLRLVLLVVTYFSDFRNWGISTVLNLAISKWRMT